MPKGKPTGKNVIRTRPTDDGAQQYVRGRTGAERIQTLSRYQNQSYADGERAFRSGKTAESNKAYKGAYMLDRAQQSEAKRMKKSKGGIVKKGK